MPFGWIGAGAAAIGAATQVAGAVSGGSGQSGAISQGQMEANAALAPYSTTGAAADKQTADLLGLNGQDAATAAMGTFQSSPGYQYSVQQGLKAVDAGAASRGMLTSGQTIKAEQTLGNNLADQDFGNYISRLNGLSNYGITAAGGQASTDTSAAGQQASIIGNTTGAVTKAISGGLNSTVTNGLTSYGTGGFGTGGVDTGTWD